MFAIDFVEAGSQSQMVKFISHSSASFAFKGYCEFHDVIKSLFFSPKYSIGNFHFVFLPLYSVRGMEFFIFERRFFTRGWEVIFSFETVSYYS